MMEDDDDDDEDEVQPPMLLLLHVVGDYRLGVYSSWSANTWPATSFSEEYWEGG